MGGWSSRSRGLQAAQDQRQHLLDVLLPRLLTLLLCPLHGNGLKALLIQVLTGLAFKGAGYNHGFRIEQMKTQPGGQKDYAFCIRIIQPKGGFG